MMASHISRSVRHSLDMVALSHHESPFKLVSAPLSDTVDEAKSNAHQNKHCDYRVHQNQDCKNCVVLRIAVLIVIT